VIKEKWLKHCAEDKDVRSYIQNQLKTKWSKKVTTDVWISQYMFGHDQETNYFLDQLDKADYKYG
jgi:hypothetical protein